MELMQIMFLRSSHSLYQKVAWLQTEPPNSGFGAFAGRLGPRSTALYQAGKARNYGTAAARLVPPETRIKKQT